MSKRAVPAAKSEHQTTLDVIRYGKPQLFLRTELGEGEIDGLKITVSLNVSCNNLIADVERAGQPRSQYIITLSAIVAAIDLLDSKLINGGKS